MVALDMQNTTDDDLTGGSSMPKPGTYHAAIDFVNEQLDKGQIEVGFVILSGTPSGHEGKSFREWFNLQGRDEAATKKCINRLIRFGRVVGLISKEDNGKQKEVDFTLAVGCQCIIRIVERDGLDKDGNPKKKLQLDFFGYWSIGDPDVKTVPVDQEMWKAAANYSQSAVTFEKSSKGSANGQQSNGHAQQPAMAGATAGAGEFDDI